MFPFDVKPWKISWTSPEAIFILLPVMVLEFLGLLVVCFVGDDWGVVDIICMVIVYPWLLIKGSSKPNKNQTNKLVKRMVGTTFAEILPVVGLLPLWSLAVMKAMENTDEDNIEGIEVPEGKPKLGHTPKAIAQK